MGGKSKAVQLIMDNSYNILQRVVMVGDGATDAQAKPPATSFIGFGGVVQRQQVKDQADWFVTNFEDLTTRLGLLSVVVSFSNSHVLFCLSSPVGNDLRILVEQNLVHHGSCYYCCCYRSVPVWLLGCCYYYYSYYWV